MGMTLQQATALLKVNIAWDKDPSLTSQEVDDLIGRHARATTWTASATHVYGDRIVPTNRNGHYYICMQGGASGSTEPSWSQLDDSVLSDGTILWQEGGIDWNDLWDVRAASHEGWMLKAGKAAHKFTFKDGDQNFEREQLIKHCQEMASAYTPIFTA